MKKKKIRRLNLIWLIPLWILVGFGVVLYDYVEELCDGIKDYWQGRI